VEGQEEIVVGKGKNVEKNLFPLWRILKMAGLIHAVYPCLYV
jgi:hypothetical protein